MVEGDPIANTSTARAREASDRAAIGRLRDALQEASARWDDHVTTEKIQTALIAELHHRIKNSLGVVTAIVSQSLQNAETLDHASTAIMGRLHALGIAHDLLLKNEWMETNGRLIIQEAGAAFHADGVSSQYVLTGEDFSIGAMTAVSLSMMINELSTNAIKYGALSVPQGTVSIDWMLSDRFRLTWKETGGPKLKKSQRQSFGSRMIETVLPGQLKGQARLLREPDGMRCIVDVPIASLQQ